MEVKIVAPDTDGIGEVTVRSKTVMSQYLDDPELTAETIVDGWLMTGDLGRIDRAGHLQLFGRKKNMIVTAEGKNIYPEDIENVFEGLPVKEFCVFAANYIWPEKSMVGEELVIVLRPETKPPGGWCDSRRTGGAKSEIAELQTHQRICGVGTGFSAHGINENQTR